MRYVVLFLILALTLFSGCIYIPDELKSIAAPVIQTFEATPSIINHGDTSYLQWRSANAQSVYIDNGIGDVATTGTFPVSPNTTTSYTITARNTIGMTTARTQIIVRTQESVQPADLPSSLPKIIVFSSDRMNVLPGEYAVLRWSVNEANRVILSPLSIVDLNGEIRVYPTETTTYILTAYNSAGDVSSSLIISVLGSPAEKSGKETILILNALPDESGSLIKGTQYLDYIKQDAACVGDTSSNLASRAFLSFDISSIPSNAIVEEAILDLSKYIKIGDPSYARSAWGNMGTLEVYHLQYGKFDDLGLNAYNQIAKLAKNGAFSNYPLSSWAWDIKSANDETPVVQNLIRDHATRCQLRFQFFTSTNWDSTSDMFCFDNAILAIKYILPE